MILDEKLSRIHFVIIFTGVNITFFPQHFLGLQGMPRRYSDYPDSIVMWNTISSSGRLLSVAGVIYFATVLWKSHVDVIAAEREGVTVDFRPRVPTSWHTFNETSLNF